jgi:WD40 repeat protein
LALLDVGTKFVTGDSGGAVCFWDATETRPASHTNMWVAAEVGSIRAVERSGFLPGSMDPRAVRRLGAVFTPDSREFVATDAAGLLKLWELQPLRLKEELSSLGSNFWGAALSRDGRWLAAGDSTGKITVWDWRSREAVTNFFEPFDWFGSLHFSGSGDYFVARLARNDHSFRCRAWRTAVWVEIPLMDQLQQKVWAMDIAPDDKLLAVGYVTGPVKLFRWPSCEYVASFTESPGSAFSVIFSPDGKRVAAGRFDRRVRVWDVATRREEASLSGHVNSVLAVAFSPDGRRLASGGGTFRDAVKLWDPFSQRELLSLQADGVFFMQLAWSPDGNTLTATALNGLAHFWRAPSWEEIKAAEKEWQSSPP